MSAHLKVGVIVIRCFALIMLLYALPVLAYGLLRVSFGGATVASDGVTSSSAALSVWAVYAVAGLVLFFAAIPLARIAGRDLD